jgi:hypothetical protein
MLSDGEFRAEATLLKLPLEPRSGEEMQKVVADVFSISPAAMMKVREVSK